jgi:hypothetical protein
VRNSEIDFRPPTGGTALHSVDLEQRLVATAGEWPLPLDHVSDIGRSALPQWVKFAHWKAQYANGRNQEENQSLIGPNRTVGVMN